MQSRQIIRQHRFFRTGCSMQIVVTEPPCFGEPISDTLNYEMPCTEKTVTYVGASYSGNIPPRAEIESANDTYSSDNQHLKTWPMIVRPRFCKLPPEKQLIMTLGPSFF